MGKVTTKSIAEKKVDQAKEMVDRLCFNAKKAQEAFANLGQEEIDHIVHQMALAGLDQHMELAKFAYEETGRGVYEDKIVKNLFATEYIYHNIKNEKTVGIIEENKYEGYRVVAEPVGTIAGVTPVTNPTSTTMFKSLIAIKTRNPIIFAFHPSAQKSSAKAAEVLLQAAVKAGAPEHAIQWIDQPSLEATNMLMNHPDVALVLATGGSGMVKSAYSTGKPALGVGPGNVPCFIEKTANIQQAVTDLILSKTFDNGMICASEQAVIIEEPVYESVKQLLIENRCYFLSTEERKKLEAAIIDPKTGKIRPAIVGQPANKIASMGGINVPEDTKILIAELEGVGEKYPLSQEKLSPVLACFRVKDVDEGILRAEEMVHFGGMGHSAVIHSNDDTAVQKFAVRIKTGRLLVNSPSTHGAIGDIYNTNIPSLTLGCGSFGNNSTTSNVSSVNLINKKRVADRQVNMQWFKVPPKIYFESGSTKYLEKMPNIRRAFIVTDPVMVKLGYVDKILYWLRKRPDYVHSEIFSDVEPDPSVETVMRGKEMMDAFQPDVIIALGGGSAMDAAKVMWLYYEEPESDFEALKQKFMDIRKRVVKYPHLGNKAKFVAIPTTSGTGSEVTSFSVITDKQMGHTKYPLAEYELTPDVAIIDPDYVQSLPKQVVADTGLDVLTHAIEAYVSVMANDYTDGLAMRAIQLVFEYLPKSYHEGDAFAREKMHNASCIAGMAFTNAFLGINHSMAHKLGAEFGIAHGRANAILLPHVIAYNAEKPTKFNSFPKYNFFRADKRYAEIARMLGLPAKTTAEGVKSLVDAIVQLAHNLNVPMSLAECGVDRKVFESKVDWLADRAFEDQCTTANPRMPLVKELAQLYRKAYAGAPKKSR